MFSNSQMLYFMLLLKRITLKCLHFSIRFQCEVWISTTFDTFYFVRLNVLIVIIQYVIFLMKRFDRCNVYFDISVSRIAL